MANKIYSGSEGIVYVGSVAVASIRGFSLEETQETIDATTMNTSGVPFRTNKATFKSWSGTIDAFWTLDDSTQNDDYSGDPTTTLVEQGATAPTDSDTDDNNRFGILQPGKTEVTLHFWFAGDATNGNLGYTANALVTSRTITSSVDGMIEASVSVIGTSALETENKGWTGNPT